MTSRVNHGKPRRLYLIIYTDETSQFAPLSKTDTVRELCAVEADLTPIPESQMLQRRGVDGFMYFSTDGEIEIVCKWLEFLHQFQILRVHRLIQRIDQAQTITFTLLYNGTYCKMADHTPLTATDTFLGQRYNSVNVDFF